MFLKWQEHPILWHFATHYKRIALSLKNQGVFEVEIADNRQEVLKKEKRGD